MTFLVISSFCLQGNTGGSGAEGKPVSLGFRSASSDLLTGCFFFFFMRRVLLNRENLDRGAKSARMDREAQRRVTELEAGLHSEDLLGFMPQKCAFLFAGVRA